MSDIVKILLVEDDPDTRALFVEVLTSGGYQVDTAYDGAQGLEKLSHGGYALILLDAMMPNMDGLTVLERLKTLHTKEKNGPVILNTNLSGDGIIAQALAAGAKDCMIKTDITPDGLLEKVKRYIAGV